MGKTYGHPIKAASYLTALQHKDTVRNRLRGKDTTKWSTAPTWALVADSYTEPSTQITVPIITLVARDMEDKQYAYHESKGWRPVDKNNIAAVVQSGEITTYSPEQLKDLIAHFKKSGQDMMPPKPSEQLISLPKELENVVLGWGQINSKTFFETRWATSEQRDLLNLKKLADLVIVLAPILAKFDKHSVNFLGTRQKPTPEQAAGTTIGKILKDNIVSCADSPQINDARAVDATIQKIVIASREAIKGLPAKAQNKPDLRKEVDAALNTHYPQGPTLATDTKAPSLGRKK